MIEGVDRVMYAYPLDEPAFPYYEQETAASDAISEIPYGEYYVPVRLLWARLSTEQPQIVPQPDGHHLSERYNEGVASMMYTLLSGRCTVGDEPTDGTNSPDWQDWFCRKTGYEIAWQLGKLQARVPGFEVRPAATNDLQVSPAGTTLSVRFLYPPQANVQVNVSVDNAQIATVSSTTLTFTPQNYNLAQQVSFQAVNPAVSKNPFTVLLATSSSDPVYQGLTDSWAYNVASEVLPDASWASRDIGVNPVAGAVDYNGLVYSLSGAGNDIWNNADAFHFAYQSITGDNSLTVHVESVQNISPWSKAALMVRSTLDPASPNVAMEITPGEGVSFQYRGIQGGASSNLQVQGIKAPSWLRLTRQGNLFTGYYSPDGLSWMKLGSQTISMGSQIYAGMAVTSHQAQKVCKAVFDNYSILPDATWETSDIGLTPIPGSANFRAGVFSLIGSGSDIYGNADAFRFAYQSVGTDDVVTAKVDSVAATNSNAKAGVMIRSTLDPASPNAAMVVLPGGIEFQYRTSQAGGSSYQGFNPSGFKPPAWVRLSRQGNLFTGSYSLDGVNWTVLGTTTITMGTQAYAGLAVTSHTLTQSCKAVFEEFSSTSANLASSPAFQTWLTNAGLNPSDTDLLDTPDHDGISVMMKYATALPLNSPSTSPSTLASSGGHLSLTFQRLNPAPVNYIVEDSVDLNSWNTVANLAQGDSAWTGPATVQDPGLTTNTSPVSVIVIDPNSISSASRLFLRLRVATAP